MTRATRDARRCALQAMYQFDAADVDPGNPKDLEIVRRSLDEAPGNEACHDAGLDLATLAWEFHEEADAAVVRLTPDWPTRRQATVDRNILRLAFFEMTNGGTPPKVAINEAVELAKEYSTEKSPGFINAVLDRIYRGLREAGGVAAATPPPDAGNGDEAG